MQSLKNKSSCFSFLVTLQNSQKGSVAEWLGKALQKLLQRFESARNLSTNQKSLSSPEGIFHIMRFSKILWWCGLVACVLLAVSCFMPWTYYPGDPAMQTEAERTFTGFYSFKNYYGRPGKYFCFFAGLSLLLKLLPRVWAKRIDLFLCAVTVAYGIRAFFEYTGTYMGIIPEKLPGIFLMSLSVLVMQTAAIFPDLRMIEKQPAKQV